MLNSQTLVTALPLTERLEAAGFALHPVQGTPLDAMVNATRSDPGLYDAAQGNVDIFVSHVAAMANKTQVAYGTSHHTATLDVIAELAITSVKKHLFFAKAVVAPAINDLYTRVKTSLAEVNASTLLGMEVDVLREPAPLENSQLQSAVRKLDGLTLEDLPLNLNLPDQTVTELQELVMTGNGSLDAAISEWLTSDNGLLLYIWETAFQQKPLEHPKSFLQLITDREYGVSNALAIYLFARKLLDAKPLEGTRMSLNTYKQKIVEFRNQAAAALCRALDKIERSIKNGVMVREVIGAKTVVYEPVYRKFLEEGGSNEMLFANAMKGTGYSVALTDLLAQKNVLAEKWNMHAALVKTAESNQRFNKTKQLIELHFNAQLAEIAGSEEGTEVNIASVHRLFKGVMEGVRAADISDLYGLCLKVMCRARFYLTDAEKILCGIEEAKRENPSLTVREAATISTINYVACWVARMTQIVSI
jgi:hypothetical protein